MREEVCPKCGVHLPSLLRDVLGPGTSLRGGTYRVDYALGRGGFGITYRAVHLALDQTVAVKEFYPREQAVRDAATGSLSVPSTQRDSYRRALGRFLREGQILARLRHPNVVRVQDLFEERETGYMAMELVEGETLRGLLDSRPGRRLSPEEAERITAQLVDALEAVHEAGVYHLDVKPDNVLVRPNGGVVLVDFGAARQGFTSGSTQAFTLEYAAPEVIAGHDVGPQSDLFEVGMLLYEMLTGERPAPALSRIIRDNWRPTPLGEPWHALVTSALHVDKDLRPPTMRDWWASRDARPAPPAAADGGRRNDSGSRKAEIRAKLTEAEAELRATALNATPAPRLAAAKKAAASAPEAGRAESPGVSPYRSSVEEAVQKLAGCRRQLGELERSAEALKIEYSLLAGEVKAWRPGFFLYLLMWLLVPVPVAALIVMSISGSLVLHMNEELWTAVVALCLSPLIFIIPAVVNRRRRQEAARTNLELKKLALMEEIVRLEGYLRSRA